MALSQKVILEIEAQIGKATQNFKAMDSEIKRLTAEVARLQGALDGLGKRPKTPKSVLPFGITEIKQSNLEIQKTNALLKQMEKEFNAVNRAGKSAGKDIEKAFNPIANLIKPAMFMAAGYALVNMGKRAIQTGFEFNSMIESANAAFTVMAGGAENASMLMGQLTNLSMRSSIALDDAANSAKQLLAYGFEVGGITKNMEMLGTITAATGGRLDDLAYVYGTLRTQNKAYARDLMQFAMRGIPIYEELGKVMGMTTEELVNAVKKGKIDIYFKDVEKAFQNMTKSGGAFFGMMQSRLNTVGGALDQFNKRLQMMLGAMMSESSDSMVTLFKTASEATSEMEPVFRSIGKDIDMVVKSFTDNLIPAMETFGSIMGVISNTTSTMFSGLANLVGNLLYIVSPLISAAEFFTGIPKALIEQGQKGPSARVASTVAGMEGQVDFEQLKLAAKTAGVSLEELGMAAKNTGKLTEDAAAKLKAYKAPNMGMTDPLSVAFGGMTSSGKSVEEQLLMIKKFGDLQKSVLTLNRPLWLKFAEDIGYSAEELKNLGLTISYVEKETGLTRWSETLAGGSDKLLQAMGAFTDTDAMKKMWESVFGISPEAEEAFYKDINALIARLEDQLSTAMQGAGAMIEGTMGNNVVKGLADAIKRMRALLPEKGAGGATKDLGPFWLPREAEVAASLDAIDDIVLSKDKALYEAKKAMEVYGLKETDTLYQQTIKNIGIYWTRQIENTKREQIAAVQNLQASNATNLARLSGDQMKIIQREYDEAITAEENAYDMKMANIAETDKLARQAESDRHEIAMKLLRKERDEKVRNAKIAIFDEKTTGGIEKLIGNLKAAAVDINGNLKGAKAIGASAATSALSSIQGTDMGAVVGGFAQGGWMGAIMGAVGQFVSHLMSAMQDVDSIKQLLNPLKTIAQAINPKVFEIFASTFEVVNKQTATLARILSPILAIATAIGKVMQSFDNISLDLLNSSIDMLADAFAWLYNEVIVPVGNTWIKLMNGLVNGINEVLRGINNALGTKIQLLNTIDPLPLIDFTETAADMAKRLEELINGMQNMLTDSIDYLTQKLKSTIDRDMETTKQLFEVGAISIAEYEKRVQSSKDLLASAEIKNLIPGIENINDPQKMAEMIKALQEQQVALSKADLTQQETNKILEKISGLTGATVEQLIEIAKKAGANTVSDETAKKAAEEADKLQKKNAEQAKAVTEATLKPTVTGIPSVLTAGIAGAVTGIVKKDVGGTVLSILTGGISSLLGFADGTTNIPNDMIAQVHKGEMIVPERFADGIRNGNVSLGSNSGGGDTIIVNVGGSVITENKLADLLAERLYTRRSRGAVSV